MIFNHKLISCNLDDKVARFERVVWKEKPEKAEDKPSEDADKDKKTLLDTPKTKEINFDFIIGCDGAYSNLRQFMMRQTDVDFEQSYIDALWCDFIIPPDANGDYKMNSKNLHLWPDDESIIMAQPDFVSVLDRARLIPSCHKTNSKIRTALSEEV